MTPKENCKRFVSAVSKRSGICKATVEQVLPAIFDEIRYQLVEGKIPHVPIDSFGTFAIKEMPRRQYHDTRGGKDKLRILEPKKIIKFAPAHNLAKEVERGVFDPTRKAFTRHPDDPIIRRRKDFKYKPLTGEIPKGQVTVIG